MKKGFIILFALSIVVGVSSFIDLGTLNDKTKVEKIDQDISMEYVVSIPVSVDNVFQTSNFYHDANHDLIIGLTEDVDFDKRGSPDMLKVIPKKSNKSPFKEQSMINKNQRNPRDGLAWLS